MNHLKTCITLSLLVIITLGCTSGYHTKKVSTAPSRGPIIAGQSRDYVEAHLGKPLFSSLVREGIYMSVYEYHREWTSRKIRRMDRLDLLTFGMGKYIISPMERFEGPKMLVSITYAIGRGSPMEDRVVSINEKLSGEMFDLVQIEKKTKGIK